MNPDLIVADAADLQWATARVVAGHYLRSAPDVRSRPFCYVVALRGERIGCLWFGRPESTRCYTGGLTYGSGVDMRTGRAVYDRWEVLNLSRVWLAPDVQPGGRLHRPGLIPGFTDRKRVWRSTLASTVIRLALARVGFDYLMRHPPCFMDEPYAIRAVLSYCDTRLHRGVIYRAAGFTLARTNAAGIETWWTPAVAPLSDEDHRAVRERSAADPRARRHRRERVTLYPVTP